jgi:hypothetical protein
VIAGFLRRYGILSERRSNYPLGQQHKD